MHTANVDSDTAADVIDNRPLLEITTLGRFEVRYGEALVSEDAKRSYRM